MSILKQCGQEATLLIEYDVSVMGQFNALFNVHVLEFQLSCHQLKHKL